MVGALFVEGHGCERQIRILGEVTKERVHAIPDHAITCSMGPRASKEFQATRRATISIGEIDVRDVEQIVFPQDLRKAETVE